MFEESPFSGFRTVAQQIDFDKSMVQGVFQIRGVQVHKRPVAIRSCIEALRTIANIPDLR